MATSTFEREITITDLSSLEKLFHIMNSDTPDDTKSLSPFSDMEIERSEQLLNQCLSHSGF